MKKKNDLWLYTTPIAHRGLFDNDFPENTEPAFLNAIECGYAIEMDVQMTADNVLVVFHDNNLLRTCGVDKDIRETTYQELKSLRPNGKNYPILTFSEFLKLIDGRTPILIEVKHQLRKGVENLLVEQLKNYDGLFAVQSFNPNIVKKVSKLAPHFIVGVLCTREISKLCSPIINKFMHVFAFKLYVPFDFLSVRVQDLPINHKRACKYNVIAWTIRSEEDIKIAEKYAKNIIFEKTAPTLSRFGEKRF